MAGRTTRTNPILAPEDEAYIASLSSDEEKYDARTKLISELVKEGIAARAASAAKSNTTSSYSADSKEADTTNSAPLSTPLSSVTTAAIDETNVARVLFPEPSSATTPITKKPLPKLQQPKYVDKSQDIKQFLSLFDAWSEINGLTEKDKCNYFRFSLGGAGTAASKLIENYYNEQLTEEQRKNYDKLRTAFKTRFEMIKPSSLIGKQKLALIKCKIGESIDSYTARFEEALLECKDITQEDTSYNYFVGLPNDVQDKLMNKSISEKESTSVLQSEAKTARFRIDRLAEALKEGHQQIETYKNNSQSDRRNQNSNSNYKKNKDNSNNTNKTRTSEVICHKCWQPGHYASKCTNPRIERPAHIPEPAHWKKTNDNTYSTSFPINNNSRPASNNNTIKKSVNTLAETVVEKVNAVRLTNSKKNELAYLHTTKPNTCWYVHGKINNSAVTYILVDSGATINCISAEFFRTFGSDHQLIKNDVAVVGVTGSALNVIGIIYATVSLGLITHSTSYIPDSIKFYVVDNLSDQHSVIVGTDFLSKHVNNININIGEVGSLTMRHNNQKVFFTPFDTTSKICTIRNLTVPPFTQVQIQAEVVRMKPIVDYTENLLIVEPIGILADPKSQAYSPDTLCEVKDNKVPFLITNNTKQKLHFPVGTQLAIGQPIKSNDIVNNPALATFEGLKQKLLEDVVNHKAMINELHIAEDYIGMNDDDLTNSVENNEGDDGYISMELSLGQTFTLPSNLTPEKRLTFLKFLKDHSMVFAANPNAPGTTSVVTHTIDTGNSPPVHTYMYRYSPEQHRIINEAVQEMIRNGIIVPSISPYSSSIVLVPKPDNTYRICIDYRKLNLVTKKDAYPLPRIDDILDSVGQAKFFSTLDCASGYWQVRMDPDSQEKTAFSTRSGHYEFQVMPFGLCNAPSTFQRLMDGVLVGLNFCYVYIDDIIITSNSEEEHIEHLAIIFNRLKEAGLTIKLSKCKFLRSSVKFLGHVIGEDGIKPDPSKIVDVKEFPTPINVVGVQSFLGLAGYYRRFIKGFASIAKPLYDLLKKDATFQWDAAQQSAFETLKSRLMGEPVMKLPNFNLPFKIYTDASTDGIGAILAQEIDGEEHVIYYLSKTLSPAQRKYGTTERECLAILIALDNFRPYIYGRSFTIVTDHQALRWLFKHRDASSKLTRWALRLQEYDYTINHRPGSQHQNADTLSRIPSLRSQQKKSERVNVITRTSKRKELGDHSYIPVAPLSLIPSKSRKKKLSSDNKAHPTTLSVEKKEEEKQEPILANIPPAATTLVSAPVEQSKELILEHPTQSETSEESEEEKDTEPEEESVIPLSDSIGVLQRSCPNLRSMIDYLEKGKIIITDPAVVNQIKVEAENYLLIEDPKSNTTPPLTILHRRWSPKQSKPKTAADTRIVIPLSLIASVIQANHDLPIGGHLGVKRTYDRIRTYYYWDGMYADVESWIKTCLECQTRKKSRHPRHLPVGIMPIPDRPFQYVHVDILGPLTRTTDGSYRYIIVFVCRLTHWVIALPLSNQRSKTCAKALLEEVIIKYGTPEYLVSDRGTPFMSALAKDLYELANIKKLTTTAYHPQTNGMAERMMSTISTALAIYTNLNQLDWHTYLPYIVYAYNTSTHELTGYTPFYMLFGHECRKPSDIFFSLPESTPEFLSRDVYVNELQRRLSVAHEAVKKAMSQENKDRLNLNNQTIKKMPIYEVNDLVYLYNYEVKKKKVKKLTSKWKGPYQIIEKQNNGILYTVQKLDKNLKLIPNGKALIVNVERMKLYVPLSSSRIPHPPSLVQ